ncbi:MAG: hypothetical protein AAF587_33635 [Bacteroidota bacterium]
MKLRCTQNSIRIRVRKSDLHSLAQEKVIREHVHIGKDEVFWFELAITDNADIDVRFQGGGLRVMLPVEQAAAWMESQQVGMEYARPVEGEEVLHVLIEKDFPCLDRENEDKSDTFFELSPNQADAC